MPRGVASSYVPRGVKKKGNSLKRFQKTGHDFRVFTLLPFQEKRAAPKGAQGKQQKKKKPGRRSDSPTKRKIEPSPRKGKTLALLSCSPSKDLSTKSAERGLPRREKGPEKRLEHRCKSNTCSAVVWLKKRGRAKRALRWGPGKTFLGETTIRGV